LPRGQADELGAQAGEESGNGATAPEEREPRPEEPAVTAEPVHYAEPRYEAATADARPERSWSASDSPEARAEALREAAPAQAPAAIEPASPPPEPGPELPSAPARKGWWQRRFSGE
jgi:ribonuclease E